MSQERKSGHFSDNLNNSWLQTLKHIQSMHLNLMVSISSVQSEKSNTTSSRYPWVRISKCWCWDTVLFCFLQASLPSYNRMEAPAPVAHLWSWWLFQGPQHPGQHQSLSRPSLWHMHLEGENAGRKRAKRTSELNRVIAAVNKTRGSRLPGI